MGMIHEISEPTPLMRAMGRVLRRARAESGLDQQQAARRACVNRETLGRYERGWVWCVPTAERIARVCGVDLVVGLVADAEMPGRTK